MTTDNNAFGQWTDVQGRLEELKNRLVAWAISGDQLPEIFDVAAGNYYAGIPDHDAFATDPELILKSLEDALSSFDGILALIPQTMRCQACNDPLDEDNYCLNVSCSNGGKRTEFDF